MSNESSQTFTIMERLQTVVYGRNPNFALLIAVLLFVSFVPLRLSTHVEAQSSDCGIADTINYPIDTNFFTLAQDFAVSSPRHQGRYHTGEDWYGQRNQTFGQPVRAAARGRVTYAYTLGWGRDGGVVIIEHEFPDGTVVYTQYGHLSETDTYPFPTPLECIEPGQVIGIIGDARPAPHLHFEVRVANPDVPGPGYSWTNPYDEGFRDPYRFITDMQARLQRGFLWRVFTADGDPASDYNGIAPPLILSDNSIMYFDEQVIKRATQDGRVLWRKTLERQPVSIVGFQGFPIVSYADGTMQAINSEGVIGETWRLDVSPARYPLSVGDWWLFPTTDGKIVGLSEDLREIVWEADNVPDFIRWHIIGDRDDFVIGLITSDNEILTLSQSGEILDRALLRQSGSLSSLPDDEGLLVYSRGGLWQINRQGEWSLVIEDAPSGGYSGAALLLDDDRLFLYDGLFLRAYSPDQTEIWSAELGGVSGQVQLSWVDEFVLLTSTGGNIITLRPEGGVCNRTQVFGSEGGLLWHDLGDDGTLRVAIADQIIGFDWERFLGGCAV